MYAVWFEMLSYDRRSAWDPKLLADQRVMHFWDEKRIVGRWFGEHVGGRGGGSRRHDLLPGLGDVAWDVYFLYGPDARWENAPSSLLGQGKPIIAWRNEFLTALRPFLENPP